MATPNILTPSPTGDPVLFGS